MYRIGLIDDEPSELRKIRRTIKTIIATNEQYEFKEYAIPKEKNDAIGVICDEIISDIENQVITALIVDYKIMIETLKVQGTEIFERINDLVSKFPVIILTERVEDSIKNGYIDADKVYEKKYFFKLEEEYSKEKVLHIFDSMKKYIIQRDKIILNLNMYKELYAEGDDSAINKIIEYEKKLEKFIPSYQSQLDTLLDSNRLKNIVSLIEKANKLME